MKRLVLFLIVVAALVCAGALAGTDGQAAARPLGAGAAAHSSSLTAPGKRADTARPETADAYLQLVPENGGPGSCTPPTNGGSVAVGCTFVLDLMVNAGSHPDSTAQQSYLTYTQQFIQNVRVSSLPSAVLTSTVTGDLGTYDSVLQNEWCNGPSGCVFRGVPANAGSGAFASAVISNPNCPSGCGG